MKSTHALREEAALFEHYAGMEKAEFRRLQAESTLDPDDVIAHFNELMADERHLIRVRRAIDIFKSNRPLFGDEVTELGRDINDTLAIAYHETLEKKIAEGR